MDLVCSRSTTLTRKMKSGDGTAIIFQKLWHPRNRGARSPAGMILKQGWGGATQTFQGFEAQQLQLSANPRSCTEAAFAGRPNLVKPFPPLSG